MSGLPTLEEQDQGQRVKSLECVPYARTYVHQKIKKWDNLNCNSKLKLQGNCAKKSGQSPCSKTVLGVTLKNWESPPTKNQSRDLAASTCAGCICSFMHVHTYVHTYIRTYVHIHSVLMYVCLRYNFIIVFLN